jgi:hypothetical protein
MTRPAGAENVGCIGAGCKLAPRLGTYENAKATLDIGHVADVTVPARYLGRSAQGVWEAIHCRASNSPMRRYRVARDMPRSRATWVAGWPASIRRRAFSI